MTEAITITAIIVSGLVAVAWLLLHFAFKAWSAERADAKAEAPGPLTHEIHINSAGESAEQIALRQHLTATRVLREHGVDRM